MNDEKILDILIEQLDILYKEYLHYKEVGNYDLVMIYSEKNAYCNVFVCLLWSLG